MSFQQPAPLNSAVAVVTGANNPMGIGAAIARHFVEHGARVMITYLRLDPTRWGVTHDQATAADEPGDPLYQRFRSESADQVLHELAGQPGSAAAMEVDLRRGREAAVSIFDLVEAQFGPCDILVNCAAHYPREDTTLTLAEDDLAETYAVNVGATLLLTQEFARRLRARDGSWGRVVNFSTDAAAAFAGQVAYGSSKAAVEALTRASAIELAPAGITVNAIAPGPIQTGYIPVETELYLKGRIPVGGIGTPADIAQAVGFLAARSSSFITGQILKVDGGHTL